MDEWMWCFFETLFNSLLFPAIFLYFPFFHCSSSSPRNTAIVFCLFTFKKKALKNGWRLLSTWVVLQIWSLALPGNLWKGKFSGLIPVLVNQKPWSWDPPPKICVLINLQVIPMHTKFENHTGRAKTGSHCFWATWRRVSAHTGRAFL